MNQPITIRVRLSQSEAQVLHLAIDDYFFDHPFNELIQEMHEKVADALVCGGYDPLAEETSFR